MSDLELLDEYARNRSVVALEELVHRHAGWVYALALRRVRNRTMAEDALQEVLLILAQRPPKLRSDGKFSAWLFGVACYTCSRLIRVEMRRRRRERVFAMAHSEAGSSDERDLIRDWETLSPHLDEALLRLGSEDRQAIVLRFYQQKSHADVAAAMGISHDAARQRVGRAVAKLRQSLLKCGIDIPEAGALGSLLTAYAIPSTPPAAVIQSAISAAGSVVHASLLGKGTLLMAAMTKTKTAVIAAIIVLSAGVGTGVVIQMFKPAGPGVPISAAPQISWQEEFDRVYRLADGENIKWVESKDFPAARREYGRRFYPSGELPDHFSFTFLSAPQGKAEFASLGSTKVTLGGLLAQLGIKRYELEAPEPLRKLELGGDWIFRRAPDDPRKPSLIAQQELLKLLQQRLNRTIRLRSRPAEQDVIVARGPLHVLPPENNGVLSLSIVPTNGRPNGSAGQSSGDVSTLLEVLAGYANKRVIDETNAGTTRLQWEYFESMVNANIENNPTAQSQLLANITKQLGIEFRHEMRRVIAWSLEEIVLTDTRPFDEVYRLEQDENVKWIQPRDFPISRVEYAQNRTDAWYVFSWFAPNSQVRRAVIGHGDCALGDLLMILGIEGYTLNALPELRSLILPGDWIVREREGVATPELLQAERQEVLAIIQKRLNRSLRLESKEIQRDVIVVRGSLRPLPLENNGVLHLSLLQTPDASYKSEGSNNLSQIFDKIARQTGRPVINESQARDPRIRWDEDHSFINARQKDIDVLLANVARQTGLEFAKESRPATIWMLSEITPSAP